MADDRSLSVTYEQSRRTADRDELERWMGQPDDIAAFPEAKPITPTEGESKTKPGALSTGLTTAKDTFLEGWGNFVSALGQGGTLSGSGQQLLGVLQMLGSLPAGAGAAVQTAVQQYAPGLEAKVAIPGGKAGETTAAGIVRSILSAPGLLLDPKIRQAIQENPIPLAEALNEDMTYGELLNIVSQFLAVPLAARAGRAVLGRGQPGGPTAPPRGGALEGEVVTEGAPPLPTHRQLTGPVVEGEVVPPVRGAIPEQATPAPREPLVTPEPQFSSSMETRLRAAQAQGPEAYAKAVAHELKEVLEAAPARPTLQETILQRYARPSREEGTAAVVVEGQAPKAPPDQLVSPSGQPVSAPAATMAERERLRAFERTPLSEPSAARPEAPPPLPDVPASTLSGALDLALKRSEQVLGEELAAIRGRVGRTEALKKAAEDVRAPAPAPPAGEVPAAAALAKAEPEVPAPHPFADLSTSEIDSVMGTLQLLWTELREAAPGQRIPIRDDLGKVIDVLSEPSTYPDFMAHIGLKKTRANADKAMRAIDDIMAGKTEGPLHRDLIDYAKRNWEQWSGQWDMGESGKVDLGMLARMGLGAALGGTQGDTPEERIVNAFLGLGIGAVLSKRLATRLLDSYKKAGLADAGGTINPQKFSRKGQPNVQASEQPFQPNYKRLTLTPDVRAVMVHVHRAMKEDILARRGPARSNDLRVQEALTAINESKMTPERVLTLGDKEMLTDTEITAARMLSVRAFEYATDIKRRIVKGEALAEGTLREALSVAGAMGRNTRVAQTRIAQAQQASSIRVGQERVGYRLEDVAQLADEMLPGMSDKQIAAMMGPMTAEQVGAAATWWTLFPRMALEGLYFSYLSGKAALRNIVGNASLMGVAIPERGIARYMPLWGSKKPGVLPGEATQMARALGESLVDHLRMLRHFEDIDQVAVKLGLGRSGAKTDRRAPALTREDLQARGVENETLLTLGDWFGNTFRFPSAVLEGTDVMSKGINGTMAHRLEAFRQATLEGLAGERFETRVGELMADVTKLNDSARQRIVNFAEEQTFTKDFDGRMMRALSAGPESEWLNLVYRSMVMPFFRVVARMTEQTLIRMPGLNLLAKQFWTDWMAGGAQRQVAQARLVFGAAVGGAFMYLESQGLITGNRPKDPKLAGLWEEAGYQERSWWDVVSQKWRSYDGLGPLTSLVAGAADTSLTIRRLPEREAAQVFAAYILSQINTLDSRTFTQTPSRLMDIIKNPRGDSQVEQVMTFLRRQIAGWLKPGVAREIESLTDPEIRRVIRSGDIENSLQREFQALLDEVRAGWPGFSAAKDEHGNWIVPPSRNRITGEPTIVESWPYNPFPGRAPKDIAVRKPDGTMTGIYEELLRLNGAGIDDLPDWMGGGQPGANVGLSVESIRAGQRLTPQEKDRWVVLMTQVVTPMGGRYAEALKAEMQTPEYWEASDGLRGTDGGKARRLQRIERIYREAAEQQLRREAPKLDEAILRRQGERAVQGTPTREQPRTREMLEDLVRSRQQQRALPGTLSR